MTDDEAGEDVELGDDTVTTTEGTRRRWWATNDVLAALLLGSLAGLIAAGGRGVIALESVPASWTATYLGVCGAAAAWVFGSAAIEAWRSAGR
jgi:hypothetical protein